jgi:acetyltransferase-like isoleucine patch superfamily enzyme
VKAVRIATGAPVAPWNDPVGETRVLEGTLREFQDAALALAGVELVEVPPTDAPYVVFGDRLWFTAEVVRKLVAGGPGRLVVEDEGYIHAFHGLQRLGPQASYDLALVPAGSPPVLEAAAPRVVDLDLHDGPVPPINRRFQHAMRPVRVGPALAHHVDHWSHVVRVNQLALASIGEEAKLWWLTHGWGPRLLEVWRLLVRTGWPSRENVMKGLLPIHKTAFIHPTAVVEASRIGEGAWIGPHAVVRGSVVAAGARIEDHATVHISVVGPGAQVQRYAQAALCVLYPGASLSSGGGFQATVLGRDAVVVMGATMLDMSFGQEVRARVDGAWQPSGQHFLGAAIGHEAVIGNGVRLNYGVDVPNGAVIVAPVGGLVRDAGAAEPGVPMREAGGRLVPVRATSEE